MRVLDIFHPMFLPSLLPRWANGKSKALSQSSAYPGAFGRAWAFAHKIVMRNPEQREYDDVVKTSARFIVTYLPPPGTLADEDSRFCLISVNETVSCHRWLSAEYAFQTSNLACG